jgi:hypothetical protein
MDFTALYPRRQCSSNYLLLHTVNELHILLKFTSFHTLWQQKLDPKDRYSSLIHLINGTEHVRVITEAKDPHIPRLRLGSRRKSRYEINIEEQQIL